MILVDIDELLKLIQETEAFNGGKESCIYVLDGLILSFDDIKLNSDELIGGWLLGRKVRSVHELETNGFYCLKYKDDPIYIV